MAGTMKKLSRVAITAVIETGVSYSDVIEFQEEAQVIRRIEKLQEWDNLKGLVFVYGKGKVLEISAASLSDTRKDSIAKLVTGYYDER